MSKRPITQRGKDITKCKWCGKKIPPSTRKRGNKRIFCNDSHKSAYHQKLRMDRVNRLSPEQYIKKELRTLDESIQNIDMKKLLYRRKTKRNQVFAEVLKLDNKLSINDESFWIASILLGSCFVGGDSTKVANLLKIPIPYVQKYEKNLINNKIWVKGKIRANWFEKDGSVAFWCDVLAAQGLIERTKD